MTVQLNAFEIFEIAMQIEQNGSRFYNNAAEIFDDPEIRRMFFRLAEWEIKHEQIFSSMRKQLSELNQEPGAFKPEQKLPVPKAKSEEFQRMLKTQPVMLVTLVIDTLTWKLGQLGAVAVGSPLST